MLLAVAVAVARLPCSGSRPKAIQATTTQGAQSLGPAAIRSQHAHYKFIKPCISWGQLPALAVPPYQRQRPARMGCSPPLVTGENSKTSVLFVCLGNICRSPTAEAVFNSVVHQAGKADSYIVDSCGTGGGNPSWYQKGGWSYHEGDPSDARMLEAARKRGVHLTSRSRPLVPEDLLKFDYIIGMDGENLSAIKTAAEYWRLSGFQIPVRFQEKVKLMTDTLRRPEFSSYSHVPDPYYGGTKGFDLVLDLLEDACEGLLADIES